MLFFTITMISASLATKLLVLSSGAGSMTPEVEAKLRQAFADHLIVEFNPKKDFEKLIAPKATVVVAGGDGTIGFVVRKLADTRHPVGILSMGTFNNFARALGIPEDLDDAIRLVKEGHPRPITLGRVNGKVFLETCAVGLFGEVIALGEAAKDHAFGHVADQLRHGMTRPFRYQLHGDLEGRGTARSLVFTNTPSTGAGMAVGDSTPRDPCLEFSVHAGGSRIDILRRIIGSAMHRQAPENRPDQTFQFKRLEVTTGPRVRVYADDAQVGRTPLTITAELSALQVILPA
jgi:diacylglycerol kinase family enzyme